MTELSTLFGNLSRIKTNLIITSCQTKHARRERDISSERTIFKEAKEAKQIFRQFIGL